MRSYCILFLFDVKAIDEERHHAITGVSNRVILTNLARLAHRHSQGEFAITVRFPMIPGVNDDDENVREIGKTVSSMGIERVDVLPYHRAGIAKYERLGRPYTLADTEPPTGEQLEHVVATLKDFGLRAQAS